MRIYIISSLRGVKRRSNLTKTVSQGGFLVLTIWLIYDIFVTLLFLLQPTKRRLVMSKSTNAQLAAQVKKLKAQLKKEEKAHEQTVKHASERLTRINEISLALRDAQNAESAAQAKLQELIDKIGDVWENARDIDEKYLDMFSTDFSNPCQILRDLLMVIDQLITELNNAKDDLKTEEFNRIKAETIAEKLEDIYRQIIQQLINHK